MTRPRYVIGVDHGVEGSAMTVWSRIGDHLYELHPRSAADIIASFHANLREYGRDPASGKQAAAAISRMTKRMQARQESRAFDRPRRRVLGSLVLEIAMRRDRWPKPRTS